MDGVLTELVDVGLGASVVIPSIAHLLCQFTSHCCAQLIQPHEFSFKIVGNGTDSCSTLPLRYVALPLQWRHTPRMGEVECPLALLIIIIMRV